MQAYHGDAEGKMSRPQGQNVKKLIVRIMARDAIPGNGGLADGLAFLRDKNRLIATVRWATTEAFAYIDAVKSARENPFGDDDEAIAGEIIRRIEEKLRGCK